MGIKGRESFFFNVIIIDRVSFLIALLGKMKTYCFPTQDYLHTLLLQPMEPTHYVSETALDRAKYRKR